MTLPPDIQEAVETLRSLVVEYQDVISLPDVDRGITALAALVERLEAQQAALVRIYNQSNDANIRRIAFRAFLPEEQER